jgi:predicted transposase YdaD
MLQVVIYLNKTASDLVYQTTFSIQNLRQEFTVIRLWEQPSAIFLRSPGLLPFAVLSNTDDKINTLREVATVIDSIGDR